MRGTERPFVTLMPALAVLMLAAVVSAAEAAEPTPASKTLDTTAPTSGGAQPTGTTTPKRKIVPFETAPRPPAMAPPPTYEGPTLNLTKVGNAISVLTKSITTLVTVKSGLALTAPVTISIGYYSPWGTQRITQSYVASTGNRFLYNDREGDGKLRQMNIDITLSEPKPGGSVYTGAILRRVTLDPLYDVTIGPLTFTLFSHCGALRHLGLSGDNDIEFRWRVSPNDQGHSSKFTTRPGNHVTIGAFAWSRAEVSASASLHLPSMSFAYKGFWPCFPGSCFSPGAPAGSWPNLVPGVSRQVVKSLTEESKLCTASAQYNVTYQLRWYPYL